MSKKGARLYLEGIAPEGVTKKDRWRGAKTWFKADEEFLLEQMRWAYVAHKACPRMDLFDDLESVWPDTRRCKKVLGWIKNVLAVGFDADEVLVKTPYYDDETREKGKTLNIEKLGEETAAYMARRSASMAKHALSGKIDVKQARAYCWLFRDRAQSIRAAIGD